jgi:uncharacterized membrane protein SpoIIM required for sporulation
MALTSAVTEHAFAERRNRDWQELEALTRRAAAGGVKQLGAAQIARIPPLYRDVAADLARAQAARYSAPLVEYLQGLTASAHTFVYARGAGSDAAAEDRMLRSRLRRAVEAFPCAVRRHRWAVIIAFLLFFVPFFAGLFAAWADPGFAFKIVPESQLKPLAEAYSAGFSQGRDMGTDAMMAGFYVHNNVGIALRCFACGIVFGLGSAFFLVQNGLAIGAIMGYVASQGAGDNILTFVVGHGSFELGAIVLSGGAGLAMGWSIVAPGEKTRLESLQSVAKDVIVIVFGAAFMLLIAAAIEGFWSGSSIPSLVKRIVGGVMFCIVLAYILLAGRGSETARGTR